MNSGKVEHCKRLQIAVDIFKDAACPLTVIDLSEASRPFPGAPPRLANPGQCINEIRDQRVNPGYMIAGGRAFGRFPDGTFKYWLTNAPGWTPRWTVTRDFKIVPFRGARPDENQPAPTRTDANPPMAVDPSQDAEVRLCKNPECCKPLPAEVLATGAWCCNDECRRAWIASLRPPGEVKADLRLF